MALDENRTQSNLMKMKNGSVSRYSTPKLCKIKRDSWLSILIHLSNQAESGKTIFNIAKNYG